MALDRDDDIVMESTTDTPEQIAEGLEIELEAAPEGAVADDAADDGGGAPEPEPAVVDVRPADKSAEPVVTKPRAVRKPARREGKAVDPELEAEMNVMRLENEALKTRLTESITGKPATRTEAAPQPAKRVFTAKDVPDDHPELKAIDAEIAKIVKPKQDDFDDFEKFEAARDQAIEDRAFLRSERERTKAAIAAHATQVHADADQKAATTAGAFDKSVRDAKARHADYDDLLAAAAARKLDVSEDLATAIFESEVGGELTYYLAKWPAEVTRLSGLSPHRQIIELGKIEARVQQALSKEPNRAAKPGARTTRAPEPQRFMVGDLPSGDTEKDLNDPNLSQQEYNRLRDKMDEASGRRIRLH